MLVRYVAGNYDDSSYPASDTASTTVGRPSTSSYDIPGRASSGAGSNRQRTTSSSTNEIITRGPAVPISQLSQDPQNAKLFQSAPVPPSQYDPMSNPGQPNGNGPNPPSSRPPPPMSDAQLALRMLERGNGPVYGGGSPSSSPVPSSNSAPSGMDSNNPSSSSLGSYLPPSNSSPQRPRDDREWDPPGAPLPPRASSSVDQYADTRGRIVDQRAAPPKIKTDKLSSSQSQEPYSNPSQRGGGDDRDSDREARGPRPGSPSDMNKKKISGPTNAQPIGANFKGPPAGGGNAEGQSPVSERDRKAKSRAFNFLPGFQRGGERPPQPQSNNLLATGSRAVDPSMLARAVFNVPLEYALAIAQIATLPAIVFRCIEYLEAKHAEEEEGIYRLSGSSAVIKGLKDQFNASTCTRSGLSA